MKHEQVFRMNAPSQRKIELTGLEKLVNKEREG
jgi:hypothetical protein